MKKMIVVCGVPRSGTSLVCQGLERLGVSFGGPLIPADEANPWGYYEHRRLLELTTWLVCCEDPEHPTKWFTPEPLRRSVRVRGRYTVEDEIAEVLVGEMSSVELFAWKTPLVARLASDFRHIFSHIEVEPVYVHALRDPSAVYVSTLAANGGKDTSEYYSRFLLTWARMVTETRDLGTAHEVWYEDWREYGPQIVLDKMADALALPRADASGLLKEREA